MLFNRNYRYLLFFVLSLAPTLRAESDLQQVIERESLDLPQKTKVGVFAADAQTGTVLASINAQSPLLPASVLKLVTTYAALRMLGGSFVIPTEFFADLKPEIKLPSGGISLKAGERSETKVTQSAGRVGKLYVRGHGDPSMVEERVLEIGMKLSAAGVRSIDRVVLDTTLFRDRKPREGLSSYAAGSSALSINFNSSSVTAWPVTGQRRVILSPSLGMLYRIVGEVVVRPGPASLTVEELSPPRLSGRIFSCGGESQGDAGSHLGEIRVRGSIPSDGEPMTEYFSTELPDVAFGCALVASLVRAGVAVPDEVELAPVPESAQPIMKSFSRDLGMIIRDLNRFSSNFIAEQTLYQLGQLPNGSYSREYALGKLEELLRSEGLWGEGMSIADGSGLSRGNRISAKQLGRILVSAYSDFGIAPDYLAALVQYGREGTMRSRGLLNDLTRRIWGKTGSLDGVSSLSGFLESKNGRRIAFVVLVNGPVPKSRSIEFEDSVVRSLLQVD